MGLSVFQSLTVGAAASEELPRVPALKALYDSGVTPRRGQVIMVAGRSGSQKSGLALFWTAMMGLPTLYFSADMSAFTAGTRLGSIVTGKTSKEVEALMRSVQGRRELDSAAGRLPLRLSFGSPIRWERVVQEVNAWVMLHNEFPAIVVFDNLMDFEGAEAGYEVQMEVMQDVTSFARLTGCTVIVLHHASDKSMDAKAAPWKPPARTEIKNGVAEKPELVLTVALDPINKEFHVACVKQRDGECDLTGSRFVTFDADPERTSFHPLGALRGF